MHVGRIVFSQVMEFVPKVEFRHCVARHKGNHRVRRFSCYDQYLCMAFAQLTYRESLRDIEMCLRAMEPKLYHAGLRGKVSRSTLADANERRSWRIYEDLAHVLIRRARELYIGESFGVQLDQVAYVLDATTIDLCRTLFPWARFKRRKSGIKLHTQMDLRGSIPCVICITDAKRHDLVLLDELVPEPGAIYIMDRGYMDFRRLYRLTQHLVHFVIRAWRNHDYTRVCSRPVDPSTGVRSDQTIRMRGWQTSQRYPDQLRRVSFFDVDTKKRLTFLTNNFDLPALTVAQLYKCRWQVELFFKWIKQYLRIKAFFGTSENAVKTQIWIAISVYVLVAIIKKELCSHRSLGEILQILSITLFEKVPLEQALMETTPQGEEGRLPKQLTLLDF
jgi:hypothetical protein